MSRLILLADDSITIQKVIELTFMDEDYQVVAVSSGDQALARLAEARPDIVIADVHMPGASGYDVCRRAKELYAGLPVLLLVGTFEPFEEADATAAGADSCLKKPFDSQELLRVVADLLPAAEAPPAAAVEAAPGTPAAEEDLELDRWDDLEIAEGGGAESEREAVWSNFESDLEVLPAEQPLAAEAEIPSAEASKTLFAGETAGDYDGRMTLEAPAPSLGWAGDEPGWGEEPPVAVPALEVSIPVPEEEPAVAAPPAIERFVAGRPSEEPRPPAASPWPAGGASSAAAAREPVAAPAARSLTEEDVERIARRVAELVGEKVLRDVAWEVIPDLAEVLITDRLRELEAQLERRVGA